MRTYDAQFMDSSLAFFVNQLDKLDPKLYAPLFNVTWSRDIQLRSDVSFMHESTSFISLNVGGTGASSIQGKPWLAPGGGTLSTVSVDGAKTTQAMRLLGRELAYSAIELERSQAIGMGLDVQQFNALNMLYQLNTDECVYIGDTDRAFKGLLNSAAVTASAVAADGTGAATAWSTKTPALIVRDILDAENAAYLAAGYAVCPSKLLIAPAQYAYIVGQEMSAGSGKSILTYVEENSMCLRINGKKLDIQPCKWLTSLGANSTNRMCFYTNDENYVRFPLVVPQRYTPYYQGIVFHAPYVWAYGEVEVVEPKTLLYKDGI